MVFKELKKTTSKSSLEIQFKTHLFPSPISDDVLQSLSGTKLPFS